MEPRKLKQLKIKITVLLPVGFMIMGLLLFGTAGTINYWPGWLFLLVLLIPCLLVIFYFLKHNPEFLERRFRYQEKEPSQKVLIKIGQLIFFIGFILIGYDIRFGWSNLPSWLIILANLIFLLSYLFIFRVFKENSYASRIIEISNQQKVVSTGPYALIRHPMYSGIIPMYLAIPLALGSFYALIFIVPVIIIIVLRLLHEEKFLLKELPGYEEYMHKVKYRLIPGIW